MCVDDFHLFSDSVFRLKKEDSEKRTLKMQVKVILKKTLQGNNVDMELKDKYETSTQLIPTTVIYDSRIAITVGSIVFLACCVFKLYSVDPVSFFRWGGRGTRRGCSIKIKNPASDRIRGKEVSNIYIIFY